MTLPLNQFSFSKYDDINWVPMIINEEKYPSVDINGTLHLVMRESNIIDAVVNDTIVSKLQEYWNYLVENYNRNNPGTEIAIEITPNYYGSVFLDITVSDHDDDDSNAVIEVLGPVKQLEIQRNILTKFGEWLSNVEEDNLAQHEYMDLGYEEFICNLCDIRECDIDEWCSMYETRQEGVTRWNEVCVSLGYTGDVIEESTMVE